MIQTYEPSHSGMYIIADGVGSYVKTADHQEAVRELVWIECKTATGKQSQLQKSFQAQVEAEGHRYFLVRSLEDLEALFS